MDDSAKLVKATSEVVSCLSVGVASAKRSLAVAGSMVVERIVATVTMN